MEKNKTARRQRRKILRLNKEAENFVNKIELLETKITKSDKEIVILQEDLGDAAQLVAELETTIGEVASEAAIGDRGES